ncbi:MAG: pyruvate formate lyase family protein, partial [Saccharofermentanales bacterium]
MGQNTIYTWHYLDGYLESPHPGSYWREAEGRYRLYANAPVYLPEHGVICGNLDLALADEIVVNRISRHFFQKSVYDAAMASDGVTPAEKAALAEKIKRFEPEILSVRADAVYDENELLAWESNLATSNHYNGHQVIDYGLLLREGIPGMIRIFRKKRDRLSLADPETADFYNALIRSFEGTAVFIRRHAELAAGRITDGEKDVSEQTRLGQIAELCQAISASEPGSFAEGLCLLWFFVGFADYDSIGRFDQYLYPLYSKSRTEGMSREEAKSLMKDFWRMLDGNGAIINMTVGGNNLDGSSALNELSWLVLEVTRELKLKGPNLCLRLGNDESDELWEAVHESLSAGQALPALYNENEIIPMLIREGIQ